ncbi:MAG TPA: hypothetical protein PLF44_04990 [Candidatus Mcinerneyibacteriales bacterium]|nr:hypothetical protein [Candidatus Mcinerneyibacteriales bacterium]HPJ70216.1 hypothetical protein [Candidatus Mcinerneyibacteriales bacterium]HPQ88931.1 hypothetical protein [Candidatus Mcinerneyibacteriales bacterium]
MKMFLVILLPLFLLFACGKDSGSGAQPLSAEEHCEQGWEAYENGDFTSALNSFNDAIETDSELPEGYVGKGWSSLRLDMTAEAGTAFGAALAYATENDLRIDVGYAALGNMENNAAMVLSYLTTHVTGTDTWVHNHDPEIDAVDIHNLMAEAYILTDNLGTEAGSAINELSAWGQVKKSLALDPADAKALELQSFLQGGVEL